MKTLTSKKLTVDREYEYENLMLDDTSLLLLYSLQYLRKDLSKASSPNQTENISSVSLNHRAGSDLYLCF